MNIQFHLTNMCNLRCKHCYQGEYDPEIISTEDFKLILEKTKKFFNSVNDSIYSLSLTGGDPLCISNFNDYMQIGNLYCDNIVILTNGLLLTPERLASLKEIRNHFRIQVSLEGPKEINDMIRGKGTYDKICTAIKNINEAGLHSSVSCTIAPYNYDKIENLYNDLVNGCKPNVLWFDRCIPFKGIGVLTTEQFKIFIDTLHKLRQRWKNENLFTRPRVSRAMQWLADDVPDEHYVCSAGLIHFTIMHNGDVMICRRLNFPVGNLLKEDWDDIMVKAVPILEEMHKLPTECNGCKYADGCNGGLKCLTYSLYKDFNKKDVNCFVNLDREV